VSDPSDLIEREDVVRRLRELHAGADDEDRPRAALLLGLAITDLAGQLPDGDPRRNDLAAEGLARLAESADASASVATATEKLRGCLAVVPDEPTAGPESFALSGGDLNWDLDWGELRGPAEAARNLRATLPFIATMLPPQDPLRHALESITEVLAAFDQGQWSPARDAALEAAITQVEASGLGTGLGLMLRVVAMFVRGHRCQEILRAGGRPDWPSTAELDALIADLESADDLAIDFGAPFQAVEGLQHLFIGCMVLLRLQVGIRGPDVRRDAAWRDGILQLLDRADDHLRQMPTAYAGLNQSIRGKLAEISVALSQAPWPPRPPSAPAPAPAAPSPHTPAAPSTTPPSGADAPPPTPGPAGNAPAADEDAQPRIFDRAISQMSQRLLDGLKLLVDQTEGAWPTAMASMLLAMDAVNSRRWTPEHSDRLVELREEAERLSAANESPRDHAAIAAMLAMANAVGSWQRSMSPRSAAHSSADEMAKVAAETESALKLVEQACDAAPDRMLNTLQGSLQALAAMQLVDLSRLDTEHRAELLARARAHFGQLPAEMLEVPVISEMSVLEKLIEGVIPLDDEAVTSVADRNPNKWDQSGGDLNKARRAVAQAGRSRTPTDIGIALMELQAVWIGLPAGSPLRAQVLIPMATMQMMLLAQDGEHLRPAAADAVGTAISAVRAAGQPDEMQAAAQLLVSMFALMLARGEREAPFEEAEEALRTALGRFAAGDWAMRLTALTAVGAAAAMRAAVSGDEALRVTSREAVDEAARLLPDPVPTGHWYAPARLLCSWTTAAGHYLGSAESARLAVRLIDMLETLLGRHPELAEVTGSGEPSPAELEGLRQLRLLLTARDQPAQDSRPDPR
jgi:hypothetical protein